MNDGAFYKVLAAKQEELWDSGIKEHKIVFSGVVEGKGTFVFEGNTIRYLHETGRMPYFVNVNERSWTFMEKPFELPFEIETACFEIVKSDGDCPAKLTRIGDKAFEVSFEDHNTRNAFYSVTIAPGESQGSK